MKNDDTDDHEAMWTLPNVTWTTYAANSTPSAIGPLATCPDGSPAPLGWLWSTLFNDHYTPDGQTTPLAGLPAVSSQAGATGYPTGGWVGDEGFGVVPGTELQYEPTFLKVQR